MKSVSCNSEPNQNLFGMISQLFTLVNDLEKDVITLKANNLVNTENIIFIEEDPSIQKSVVDAAS